MSGRRRRLALLLAPALGGLLLAQPGRADYAFGAPTAHPGGVTATDRILFAGEFTQSRQRSRARDHAHGRSSQHVWKRIGRQRFDETAHAASTWNAR